MAMSQKGNKTIIRSLKKEWRTLNLGRRVYLFFPFEGAVCLRLLKYVYKSVNDVHCFKLLRGLKFMSSLNLLRGTIASESD